MDQTTVEKLRAELEEQAQVFQDPGAYLAGVEDVFQALMRSEPARHDLPPEGGWFG